MLHKVQRQDENQLRESLSPGHCAQGRSKIGTHASSLASENGPAAGGCKHQFVALLAGPLMIGYTS